MQHTDLFLYAYEVSSTDYFKESLCFNTALSLFFFFFFFFCRVNGYTFKADNSSVFFAPSKKALLHLE